MGGGNCVVCDTMDDSCVSRESGSIIARTQNYKRIEISNSTKSAVCVWEVDGCLIASDSGVSCDYMFCFSGTYRYYVELKGRNAEHAVRQLEASIVRLEPRPRRAKIKAFVVCSSSPAVGPAKQQMMVKFARSTGGVPLKFFTDVGRVRVP